MVFSPQKQESNCNEAEKTVEKLLVCLSTNKTSLRVGRTGSHEVAARRASSDDVARHDTARSDMKTTRRGHGLGHRTVCGASSEGVPSFCL